MDSKEDVFRSVCRDSKEASVGVCVRIVRKMWMMSVCKE